MSADVRESAFGVFQFAQSNRYGFWRSELQASVEPEAEHALAVDRSDQRVVLRHAADRRGDRYLTVERYFARHGCAHVVVVVVGLGGVLPGRERRRDRLGHAQRRERKRRLEREARIPVPVERAAVAQIEAPHVADVAHAAVHIERAVVDRLDGFEDAAIVHERREVEKERSAEGRAPERVSSVTLAYALHSGVR